MDASAGEGSAIAGAVTAAGRRCYVAVLFADLSGSTGLAASLDADLYADMLEAIRGSAARIITSHGGSIAQVYGDGILSLFQDANGTARAIDAALAMHAAVAALAVPGVAPRSLRLHSGIHSGLVLLRPGDAVRGRLEAIGRTTSIAARLSAAAQRDEILVSLSSLGPDQPGLGTGTMRAVDIGDGAPPITAVPVMATGAAAAALASPPRHPFIGRAAPLAALGAALEGLVAGQGFRIAVAAPPGQGKSRLAEAFAEPARNAGVAVFRGTCSPGAAVGPLQPFRQIAAAMAPAAQPMPAADVADALVADVTARAAAAPLVLVLDDWQWADSASVAVLGRLRAIGGRLGVLLLSRERDPMALPLEGFTRLDLPPLTLEETTALVRARRPAFDPLDAQRIHLRAGGNPLYAVELCRLAPGQALSAPGNRGETVAAGWLASLVGARVDQLPRPAQALLETAAVIGQAPPRWLLEAMVGAAEAAALVPQLIEADLLTLRGEGGIEFSHGITWEIIYSLIPLVTRRRLHAAVAEALAGHAQAPAIDFDESLAWHTLASDQPASSWPHAERAGDRAVRLGSLDRAQLHYRMALETLSQLPALPDPARERALVAKFGYVCIFDADPAQFAVLETAIARAQTRGDTQGVAQAEYWLGYVAHGCGRNRAAIAHCTAALALVADAPTSPFAVQVRATLGQAYAVATDYARAIPLLDEAIAIKRQHRSGAKVSTGLAYSLAQRAAVHADMGDFAAAHALIDEAQGLLGAESPPVEASILGWVAAIAAWEGDWQGMLAAATRGCDVALRIEAVYIHAICRAFAAFARWKMGGGDAAADELAAAVDCMVDRDKNLSLSIAFGFLAEVEVARGNVAAARRAVAGAFARARAGDPMGVAWASRAWACQLAAADPARAAIYLARARTNARQRQSPPEAARCDAIAAWLGLDGAAIAPLPHRLRVGSRAEGRAVRRAGG